jgi:hypothetical protein
MSAATVDSRVEAPLNARPLTMSRAWASVSSAGPAIRVRDGHRSGLTIAEAARTHMAASVVAEPSLKPFSRVWWSCIRSLTSARWRRPRTWAWPRPPQQPRGRVGPRPRQKTTPGDSARRDAAGGRLISTCIRTPSHRRSCVGAPPAPRQEGVEGVLGFGQAEERGRIDAVWLFECVDEAASRALACLAISTSPARGRRCAGTGRPSGRDETSALMSHSINVRTGTVDLPTVPDPRRARGPSYGSATARVGALRWCAFAHRRHSGRHDGRRGTGPGPGGRLRADREATERQVGGRLGAGRGHALALLSRGTLRISWMRDRLNRGRFFA